MFYQSKDVGSNPHLLTVAFKFFFHFFFRFARFFVFIIEFVHNWMHLFEFGMRLCNKYTRSTVNIHVFNKPTCDLLFARYNIF